MKDFVWKDFVWSSGHLGWGIFALAAFTLLWWLLSDLIWRLKNVRVGRLLGTMFTGWIVAVALILLVFYFGGR